MNAHPLRTFAFGRTRRRQAEGPPPTDSAAALLRYLPQSVLATLAVVAVPVAVAWALIASGTLTSAVLDGLVAVALSVAISWGGSAIWKRRTAGSELLFADLMAWSWARRWLAERRLGRADVLLSTTPVGRSADPRAEELRCLALDLQARDPYTQGHVRRVSRYATLIARQMGLADPLVAEIGLAASLHDLGKMRIPRAILNKPGPLSAEELAVMRTHVESGARLLAGACDQNVVEMVRHHHERLDGSGYPDGLAGEAIPLGARIIAVADTFDAMISTRPYRPAKSHKRAMDALAADAGSKLDPSAVDAFRRSYAGRRGLGLLATLVLLPQRMLSALGADLSAAGLAPLQTSLATVALTAGLGAPLVRAHSAPAPRAVARTTVPPAYSGTSTPARAARPAVATTNRAHANRARIPHLHHPPQVGVAPLAQLTGGPTLPVVGGAAPSGRRPGSAGGNQTPEASGTHGPSGTAAPPAPTPAPAAASAPPAASPTLIDRVVGIATTVTRQVPPPVGPLATGALNSAAATADRILPLGASAPPPS
jgi:HD domain